MDEDQGARKGCQYFVARKRRYCRMTVKEGQHFCGEHIDHNEIPVEHAEVLRRIPCPYDPKHSVTAEMSKLTDMELAAIGILLDEEEEEHHQFKKRKWVHEAWQNRECDGEFATLYKELIDDETKFFEYFRMSENCFNILLSKLEVHLKRQDIRWRKALTRRERFAFRLSTCFEQRLQNHLKKCNARQKQNPDYIIPGINNDPAVTENKRTKSLAETEGEDLLELIEKIKYISEDVIPVVAKEIYCHSVLADELKNPEYGPSTLKHRLQNASLLGHIEHSNLLQPDTCFIEFGAGRGQLSFWLGQVACRNQHNLLLLVDKESHRHKFDKQLLLRSEVQVQRLRANIADLSLAHVPTIQEYSHWVGISKHLCGAATDLALRCFTTTCNIATSMGIIMAPCCHHKGDWSNYIGKEFLLAYGINAEEFWPMTGIASWATCGISNCMSRTAESDCKQSNRFLTLNLRPEEKEDIGRKCKQILDYGRLKYLEALGFRSKLVYYISEQISPENLCMVAVKE
ncbi:tRNA:m(4)X modification enzyme TRM13 homolog isoform X2 [Anabrus simplex]|uniref:tRNA:m(4)X modification enzyme TRM13 homolog isoform X2 n=1 Tax=Anabrus simplex TaxID=316456 RepID=UPI0035A29D4C